MSTEILTYEQALDNVAKRSFYEDCGFMESFESFSVSGQIEYNFDGALEALVRGRNVGFAYALVSVQSDESDTDDYSELAGWTLIAAWDGSDE